MADRSILEAIYNYLQAVDQAGIQASRAVLFGSWARDEAHPDSDIDLLIIAPEFDGPQDRQLSNRLWELRALTDWRIEPIACGERQWLEDDTSPIIEIARREGQIISLSPETA